VATTCQGDDASLASRPSPWHVGGAFGIFGSSLIGTGLPSHVAIQREAITASVDYRRSPETTFGGGVGVGLGGLMSSGPRRFLVLPGWELTFAYSRRLLDGRGKLPFLLLGISAGGSGASTREEVTRGPEPGRTGLYAFDARVGITIGKTFWNTLSPYAVARAFGGPVLWSLDGKSVLAGDLYHVQLGAGVVTALPRGFDVFVEGVPLGERAVTLGLGKSL